MCCNVPPNSTKDQFNTNRWVDLNPGNCGCGCIGQDQMKLRLEHYQDHLKAELKSVERQLNALQKPEK